MRFLDSLTGSKPAETTVAPMVDAAPAPSAAPVTSLPVDHEPTPPAEPHIDDYRPNPKVAVAVAGAALAVTTGLTLLIIPYVRQAATMQQPTQFLNQGLRGLPARPALRALPVRSSEAFRPAPPPSTTTATSSPPPELSPETLSEIRRQDLESAASTVPLENSDLVRWREFNNAEEDALFGPAAVDEEGAPLEPVSPWLGFKALGIATFLVGSFTALGVYGAAKFLGVSSMEEFAQSMRGKLESGMPELVESVRKDEGVPIEAGPNVLGNNGDVDDSKLRQWLDWIEGEKK